jgi:hypothetical protein
MRDENMKHSKVSAIKQYERIIKHKIKKISHH